MIHSGATDQHSIIESDWNESKGDFKATTALA